MMLFLASDVVNDLIELRYADTEGAVFLLPAKKPLLRKVFVNPFRGISLDQLHGFGDRKSGWQREHQMNVIGVTPPISKAFILF